MFEYISDTGTAVKDYVARIIFYPVANSEKMDKRLSGMVESNDLLGVKVPGRGKLIYGINPSPENDSTESTDSVEPKGRKGKK